MGKFALRKNWKTEVAFLRKMAGQVRVILASDCDAETIIERLMKIEQRLRDRADRLEVPESMPSL